MATATSTARAALPMLLETVTVRRVERLSPSFVRLELGAPALADLGVDGPLLDQRFKLVLPDGDGPLPSFEAADSGWYAAWQALPQAERGHMRTYTIRDIVGEGEDTRLVVDVVLHDEGPDGEHPLGPGARWASRARVGDRAVVLAPRRGVAYGGIEFAPRPGARVLLVGDETAVPAVAGILAGLDADAEGHAFVEVPCAADVQDLPRPAGVELTWLPRDGAPRGVALQREVLACLESPVVPIGQVEVDEVDPDLWETPTYSSSGEVVAEDGGGGAGGPGARRSERAAADRQAVYAWIAGESKVVTGLRRVMVRDLGMDRRQVAFMGYWREGVAMRS